MKLLGVDLGGTNVRVGMVEDGRIGQVVTTVLDTQRSESEICEQLYKVIDQFVGKSIAGIGIGVPSVVDVERGIVYEVQNIPSWKKVPLKGRMEDRYRIPVYVNNDANCFAAGEKFFGKGQGYNDIVGLIIGTGLGAGLIVNDILYTGANCGAGEFGMIPYKDSIFESYCSGQFFKREYKMTGEQLSILARKGNQEALKIFTEFGVHLGRVLEVILLTIDPEIIILGGSVSKSFEFFKDSMWATIRSFPYSRTIEKIIIEATEIEHIAILGAAALYYDGMNTGHYSTVHVTAGKPHF